MVERQEGARQSILWHLVGEWPAPERSNWMWSASGQSERLWESGVGDRVAFRAGATWSWTGIRWSLGLAHHMNEPLVCPARRHIIVCCTRRLSCKLPT
eukprot:5833020-Prymnesium_polylepis.2